MNYSVGIPSQLRAVLRALRQSRGLTQSQVGQLLGVNQKRIAAIEGKPEVTGFDQIARLVSALGGRLLIETVENKSSPAVKTLVRPSRHRKAAGAKASKRGNW